METVLVAFDGSQHSVEALRFALRNYPGSEITALYVIDPAGKGGDRSTKAAWWNMFQEDRKREAEEALEGAKEIAAELGADLSTVIRTGKPSKEIIKYAEKEALTPYS